MLIIGIVGGVASGKSTVAGLFGQLGAKVLDVDRMGHEVLRLAEVQHEIRRRWGPEVFNEDGTVDRQRVANIVFASTVDANNELPFLEQLIHPRISDILVREIDELRTSNQDPVIVLDAAVLLKAGWDKHCDRIVFVDATRQQRIERCLKRGWSEAEFEAREAAQLDLETKKSKADVIIDNSSLDAARVGVDSFWSSLRT